VSFKATKLITFMKATRKISFIKATTRVYKLHQHRLAIHLRSNYGIAGSNYGIAGSNYGIAGLNDCVSECSLGFMIV
jgi:hypothetical protein